MKKQVLTSRSPNRGTFPPRSSPHSKKAPPSVSETTFSNDNTYYLASSSLLGAQDYFMNHMCSDAAEMMESVIDTMAGGGSGPSQCSTLPISEITILNPCLDSHRDTDSVSCLEVPVELQDSNRKDSKVRPLPPHKRQGSKQQQPKAQSNAYRLGNVAEEEASEQEREEEEVAPRRNRSGSSQVQFHRQVHGKLERLTEDLREWNQDQEEHLRLTAAQHTMERQGSEQSYSMLNPLTPQQEEAVQGPPPVSPPPKSRTPRPSPTKKTHPARPKSPHLSTPPVKVPRAVVRDSPLWDRLDPSGEFDIHWAVQRNVLPGLDRWKGLLHTSSTATCAPLGLVQGFWIRRHAAVPTQGQIPSSWGPTRVRDLKHLQELHASLRDFWQTTLKRGWPTATPQGRSLEKEPEEEDGSLHSEESVLGEPPSRTTTDECCLITQVWVAPQYRGDGWGLALASKASRAIPRRYERRRQEEVAQLQQVLPHSSSSHLRNNNNHKTQLSLVLAVPPYTPKLRQYFCSAQGGWHASWDKDFLIK